MNVGATTSWAPEPRVTVGSTVPFAQIVRESTEDKKVPFLDELHFEKIEF
jgi:hypothetical protein